MVKQGDGVGVWTGAACLRPVPDRCPWWGVLLLCVVAVVIGVVVRGAWINWADQVEAFKWNGHLQPTTQDSFFHGAAIIRHGEGGLQGVTEAMPLLNHHGVIHLIGIGMRRLGWMTTDEIVLWFPVILGSLIAIPVVLIGRRLGSTWMGFGASILAVVAVNYYERSMAGYYDHDMLSVSGAAMIAWLLMEVDARGTRGWLLTAALAVFLFPLVYTKGIAIVVALVVTWAVMRVLIHQRNTATLVALVVIILAAALSPLSNGNRMTAAPWMWFASIAGIIVVWWWMTRRPPTMQSMAVVLLICLMLAAVLFPWDMVWYQLQAYLKIGDVGALAQGRYADISFRAAHKASILEAQNIPLDEIGWRIIGASWLAVFAIIGFLLLCIASPAAIVLAPLAAVAFFSIPGGLRFTTWGTVPAAMGVAFCVFVALRWLTDTSSDRLWRRPALAVVGVLACAALAWPSIAHALAFKVGTIFSKPEIEAFEAINANSEQDDLVLAWWDYGTGVWYYADRDVLVHPAYVSDDAVAISRILTSDSQLEAARLSLSLAAANERGLRPAFHAALDEAGFGQDTDAASAIAAITAGEAGDTSITNNVLIYMPLQEVSILQPIASFSRNRLHQGDTPAAPLVLGMFRDMQSAGNGWLVTQQGGIGIEAKTGQPGIVGAGGRITPVRLASVTSVNITDDGVTQLGQGGGGTSGPWVIASKGGMTTSTTKPDPTSQLHLLIFPQAATMIIANDAAMATNAIRMGVLGLIDESLFEQLYVSPHARVFRVRSTTQPAIEGTAP